MSARENLIDALLEERDLLRQRYPDWGFHVVVMSSIEASILFFRRNVMPESCMGSIGVRLGGLTVESGVKAAVQALEEFVVQERTAA